MTKTQVDVRVWLYDRWTGDAAWHVTAIDAQYAANHGTWWTEGNGSCDCNRLEFLHRALGRPEHDDEDAYPCGHGRVVLLDATIDGLYQPWGKEGGWHTAQRDAAYV